jgi:hypothetical protein
MQRRVVGFASGFIAPKRIAILPYCSEEAVGLYSFLLKFSWDLFYEFWV